MRFRCALLIPALPFGALACETPPAVDDNATASLPPLVPSQSAEAVGPPPAELAVPDQPDPEALEELVRAAPAKRPPATGPDGGTLVGSKTDSPRTDAHETPEPERSAKPPGPTLVAGRMELQRISNPAMERTAREQIYWPLVQKCRGPDGKILPPDTITLSFTIRRDGSVNPATVNATANDKRYEQAADCVVREFSALSFTPPPNTIVIDNRVISTLPSVN